MTNYFYGNPVYAIDVGQQKGCVITGNTIDNSTGATSTDYGIFMESVVPTSRSCSIAHNIVRNAGTFGIYIAGDNRFIDIVANDVGAIRNPSVVGAFHIVSNSTANIVANIVHGEDDGNAVEGIGLIGVGSKIQGSISANQIFSTFRDIHVDGTDDVSVSSNLLASTTIMAGTVLLIGPNATGTIVTSNDITGVPVGAQNWIIDNGGNSFIQQLNKAANAFYFLNQNIGIATSTPQTALDVNGLIRTYQTSTTSCSTLIEGAIFYNATAGNKHFFGCDGTNWKQLDN